MEERKKELEKILSRMGNDVISLIGLSRNLGVDYDDLIRLVAGDPGKTFEEPAGFRDRVILEHRDKDGNLIERDEDGNLIAQRVDGNPIGIRDSGWQNHRCLTNTGFAEVAGILLTDIGGTAWDYLAIGTGAVAADPTDATLGAEEARKTGTGTRQTTAVANDTSQLVATFAAADGLAGTDAITEVGMFNATPAGIMLMRQVFAVLNIDWDSADTLAVTVKIQVKQGA